MRAGPRERSELSKTLPDPLPTRANLGCGYDRREGYLNIDLYPHEGTADFIADISDLSIFPSNHFDELIAHDVIEHFERDRVAGILSGWARLLKPEGILILRTPSLFKQARHLFAPENLKADRAAHLVHLIFGTQAYLGDYHLTGFTPALLLAQLSESGLTLCRSAELDPMNFNIVARKTARLTDPEEIVHNAYFRILHRTAAPPEIAYWASVVRDGTSAEDLDGALMASKEARLLGERGAFV